MLQNGIMLRERNWWWLAVNINERRHGQSLLLAYASPLGWQLCHKCSGMFWWNPLTWWIHQIKAWTPLNSAVTWRTVEAGDHPRMYLWHMHLFLLTVDSDLFWFSTGASLFCFACERIYMQAYRGSPDTVETRPGSEECKQKVWTDESSAVVLSPCGRYKPNVNWCRCFEIST